jgi:H3 lysine-79-specific histone-lysine N-methyltransferase
LWAGQNEEEDELGIVHAVEVASLADKCRPVMGLEEDEVGVRLRYPGANYLER